MFLKRNWKLPVHRFRCGKIQQTPIIKKKESAATVVLLDKSSCWGGLHKSRSFDISLLFWRTKEAHSVEVTIHRYTLYLCSGRNWNWYSVAASEKRNRRGVSVSRYIGGAEKIRNWFLIYRIRRHCARRGVLGKRRGRVRCIGGCGGLDRFTFKAYYALKCYVSHDGNCF